MAVSSLFEDIKSTKHRHDTGWKIFLLDGLVLILIRYCILNGNGSLN